MSNPSPSPGSRPLEQLKVAELRDELRKRGLSLKGVKKDLFERLDEAVRKEQAGAPLGVPEVVENQHEGVQEGEHVVAQSGGLPHCYNTLEAAQVGDNVSYLNDGENCLQDSTLIVNNAYVGASDATPVFMEPRKDMEKLNTGYVVNEGSIDDVASVHNINNVSTGDLPESGSVGAGDDGGVLQADNSVCEGSSGLLEADDQAVGNAAVLPESSGTEAVMQVPDNQASRDDTPLPEPGNQASGSDTALPEAGTRAGGIDAMLPEAGTRAGGINAVLPEPLVQAGATHGISDVSTIGNKSDTVMAEPMDGSLSTYSGNDALVDENTALVKDISGEVVASIGEIVIPCESDKDVASAPVSDDALIVADASTPSIASDNVVTESSCSVQDVEVFENTILTGVSVVPCVQESVENRDGGSLKIETPEVGKDNLLVEDTEQGELQSGGEAVMPTSADNTAPEMPQGVAMSEAVQHPILPEVQQDILTPESLQDNIVQEAAQDLVMQEVQQDIEMSEAQESAFVKVEASNDTKPPAAVMGATDTFVDTKAESLGKIPAVDSGKHRGRLVDQEKLDVKLEPIEAESQAGRRPVRVENVKVELQDVKEELPKSGWYFGRSRPKENIYERSRHDPFKYGDERNRAEGRTGRVFKEEGRKDARERDLKPDEESSHVRSSQKRKDDGRDAKQQEPAKRVRRWNSGNQLVVETATQPLTTGTVKEIMSPETKKDGFAVVPPKLTPKSTGPSRQTPPAAKADSEANGDKRAVPPSTRAPTASLKIERFVRPFTLKAVRDLVSEFGQCVDFWMDQIKTHCYVTYSKVDEAVAARNGLYHKQWPPSFGNLLVADFVESSEVKIRSDGTFEKTNVPPATTTPRGITTQPAPGAQLSGSLHGHSNSLASAPPLRERQLTQVPVKDPEPPIPTLDDLFRKTKAKPNIYYLPLTDEQVAEKLASVKDKEQQPVRGKPLGRV